MSVRPSLSFPPRHALRNQYSVTLPLRHAYEKNMMHRSGECPRGRRRLRPIPRTIWSTKFVRHAGRRRRPRFVVPPSRSRRRQPICRNRRPVRARAELHDLQEAYAVASRNSSTTSFGSRISLSSADIRKTAVRLIGLTGESELSNYPGTRGNSKQSRRAQR